MKSIFQKKFSILCLSISFIFLIYTFYKSEIYWEGAKSNFFTIYYIISGTLIIFSILTFYLNKKIKEYLIIASITIFLSLYFFETYLIFNNNYVSNKTQDKKELLYKKKTGKNYDNRTRFELYRDLKKVDNDITVDVVPHYYLEKNEDFIPLSGTSKSKTINCIENGYFSIFNADRFGFNNPDKEWDQKKIEYLLIGDSFTHGACVNRPNDIASVLRSLSNRSILNLGSDAAGPLVEYAILREYLDSNVKKILWLYYEGNDTRNLSEELNYKVLKNYLSDLTFTQNLKTKQTKVDNLINALIKKEEKIQRDGKNKKEIDLIKFIKISNIRSILNLYLPEKNKPSYLKKQPKLQPEFKKILQLANNLASKNNSKLFFVYLPEYAHYKNKYDNSTYLSVKSVVNELNIPLIDIHIEVFLKESNPLALFPFELDGHYNVEGYKKVANAIFKLTKNYNYSDTN